MYLWELDLTLQIALFRRLEAFIKHYFLPYSKQKWSQKGKTMTTVTKNVLKLLEIQLSCSSFDIF